MDERPSHRSVFCQETPHDDSHSGAGRSWLEMLSSAATIAEGFHVFLRIEVYTIKYLPKGI